MPPERRLPPRFTPRRKHDPAAGEPAIWCGVFVADTGGADADEEAAGMAGASGAARLATQAAMGSAMGLAVTLLLIVVDPAVIATLIAHGGKQAIVVCVGTIVLTFGIGATLTGAIFILTEHN